jgi:hypothetical protein
VKNGVEIVLVRGDQVVIKSAVLKNGQILLETLNFVGFTDGKSPAGQDQNLTINTGTDLLRSWSESGQGNVYAVSVSTQEKLHGAVYVRLVDPVLNFATISVNGATRVLRHQEPLVIANTDVVKVERVETNVTPISDVVFRVTPEKILFLRGDQVFAEIPIDLQIQNEKAPTTKAISKVKKLQDQG